MPLSRSVSVAIVFLAPLAACSSQTSGAATSTQSQTLSSDAPKEGRGGPGDRGLAEGVARGHRAPPPEAFTACEGKAADAACTVALGDKTINGTCRTPPRESGETRLICFPERPPGGHRPEGANGRHHGPPPAAFDACSGKPTGQACSVTFGDRTIDGTCEAAPPGAPDNRVSCRPSGPPPGGPPPQ